MKTVVSIWTAVLLVVMQQIECKFLVDGKEMPPETHQRKVARLERAAYTKDEDGFNEKITWEEYRDNYMNKDKSLGYSSELALEYFPKPEGNIRKRQYLWALTKHWIHELEHDFDFQGNDTLRNRTIHGFWKGMEGSFN